MSIIQRTSKEINKETIKPIAIGLLSIGGLSSYPYKINPDEVIIEERYVNKFKNGYHIPYDPNEKGKKFLNSVVIFHPKFDTRVVIWQEGRIQGYYRNSGKPQFAPDPLMLVNLLLKNGFLEVKPNA